jgi:hypothetical protein
MPDFGKEFDAKLEAKGPSSTGLPTKPRDYEFLGVPGLGMSNLSGIDDGLDEKLKSGPYYAQHSAWDFCGYIWWDRIMLCFMEEIWQYGNHVDTKSADTLQDMMHLVNSEYGYS